MPTNHHKRTNYINQYIMLCKETGDKPISYTKTMSNKHLLLLINNQLIKLNCIPFTEEELEIELQ